MSTLSRVEDNYIMMSSEESSSYLDESELELGLGLSLRGCGGKAKTKSAEAPPVAGPGGLWDHQYARILTAKDFSSVVSSKASSSSSSSSVTKAEDNHNGSCGTKRTAEPSSPPGRSGVSRQVVGWPPIRTYRVNSLVNHVMKSPSTEGFTSTVDKFESKNNGVNKTNYGVNTNYGVTKKKGLLNTSFLVKVNMDGFPIGRKVDMNAHSCYESLAHTLEGMFRSSAAQTATRSNAEEQVTMPGARRTANLLDVSSDFVLTYEDKEGDWMLVGDVPWEMFLSSVKRLRIIRTAEVNGLGMYRVFGAKFFHAYSHVFLCLHAHLFLFLVAAPSLLKKTGDS